MTASVFELQKKKNNVLYYKIIDFPVNYVYWFLYPWWFV